MGSMMERLSILNNKHKKQMIAVLKEQFGYEGAELDPYVFLLKPRDGSIKIVNRDIERIDSERLNIDSQGLKIGKQQTDGIVLTIEGSQLIGNSCTSNIVEVTKKEMREWLKGNDISVESNENRYVIVKCEKDFAGSGKQKEGKIINSIPKARQLNVSD